MIISLDDKVKEQQKKIRELNDVSKEPVNAVQTVSEAEDMAKKQIVLEVKKNLLDFIESGEYDTVIVVAQDNDNKILNHAAFGSLDILTMLGSLDYVAKRLERMDYETSHLSSEFTPYDGENDD